ncbi:MAG: potassium transporter TrkA [Spirochaetia bacterium]|nr:potassium transporter TrkA [Spirochaetia bacterium]
MPKITLKHKFKYYFDNMMSKGAIALILYLSLLTLLLILGIAAVDTLAGLAPADDKGETPGFGELLWMSLMRTLDPGTMGGDSGSWVFLFSMFTVTIGGIFIVSTLVGILSSGIDQKLEEMRKGKSLVVEKDHTLILGWSENIFTIISEICEANKSRGRACIVILAEKDKVEMDDEISARIENRGKTKIVCRTGNPIDFVDLDIANPQASRSIIILSGTGEDADAQVIKSTLAIVNNPNRRAEPYHIVAELKGADSVDICKMIGKEEVKTVLSPEVIARIMVQTCRQPGLSVVYTELLDFGGDEIYIKAEPSLTGSTYADLIFKYPAAALMGIVKKNGAILLNPKPAEKFEDGDRIIAIAEDDDKILLGSGSNYGINTSVIRAAASSTPKPERTLLLGWNSRGSLMVNELDQYVGPGSTLCIVTDNSDAIGEIETIKSGLKNQKLELRNGHPTERALLDDLLKVDYDHIITISDSERLGVQHADANTLISLLHLRDMETKSNRNFSIVSEMLDNRNRELAEVTGADDFIVSDKLISLMMSQISESKELSSVFEELFQPEGSEIYLKPATDYVETGKEINFYTVLEAAKQRGETAIGYRKDAESSQAEKQYGVYVNPKKTNAFTLGPKDRIIVLAES